jgi:competence protein ComEC
MLPTLTVAFLAGLVLGSYLPYVPLSVFSVLLLAAFGLTWAERRARTSSRGIILYTALLAGVLYWNLYAWAVHRPPL